MPIRGLDSLNTYFPFTTKLPSTILKDTTICVDGIWFIKKYILLKETHQTFINGILPHTIKILENFVNFIKKNEVTVIWIWNGLRMQKSVSFGKPEVDMYLQGLQAYEGGNTYAADSWWKKCIDMEDYVLAATEFLKRNNIIVVRAPYSALAQASYFCSINVCSYVFGPTDFLLYEFGEKLITEFLNLKTECVQLEIIKKADILRALKLNFYKFQGYGLLLGCEYCPTYTPYATNFNQFEILNIVNHPNGILSVIENSAYTKNYVVGRMILKYHPVMGADGCLRTFSIENVPSGLEEIFGAMLPGVLYEKMFKNEISPSAAVDCMKLMSPGDATSQNGTISLKEEDMKFYKFIENSMLDGVTQFLILKLLETKKMDEKGVYKLLILNNKIGSKLDLAEDTKLKGEYLLFLRDLKGYYKFYRNHSQFKSLVDKKVCGDADYRDYCIGNALYMEKVVENKGEVKENVVVNANLRFLVDVRNFMISDSVSQIFKSDGGLVKSIKKIVEEIDRFVSDF